MNYLSLRSTYFIVLCLSNLAVLGSQRTNSLRSYASQRTNSSQQNDSQQTEIYSQQNNDYLGYESDNENTPLHRATLVNDKQAVRKLLQQGANPNAVNKYKETPLHKAIIASHIKLGLLLARHGADLKVQDDNNKTPLDYLRYNSIPGNQLQYFENPEAYYCPQDIRKKLERAAQEFENSTPIATKLQGKKRSVTSEDNESSSKKSRK